VVNSFLATFVGILGTTIALSLLLAGRPEVEEDRAASAGRFSSAAADAELRSARRMSDGHVFSNVVMYFII
jgi:hypothetical protein